MNEKFDFSKIEDQKKFDTLSIEEKSKIIDKAQDEAEKMNSLTINEDLIKQKKIDEFNELSIQHSLEKFKNNKVENFNEMKEITTEFGGPFLGMLHKGVEVKSRHEFTGEPLEVNNENLDYLKKLLKGQTVIEIGCGNAIPTVKDIMKIKPKRYVGIDINSTAIARNIDRYLKEVKLYTSEEVFSQVKVNFINADGLSFLKSLPDNSVAIVTNAFIDGILYRNMDYVRKLFKEIVRVSKVMMHRSDPNISNEEYPGIDKVYDMENFGGSENWGPDTIVYKKKKELIEEWKSNFKQAEVANL